ncbi:hypothetical protein Ae201684_007613 [Aphanomyces euteiches]|uniref:Uncharacterized protein n=1 Tax=Aphanomyces euteiches TaxID=100861 RepID=A0A6G0X7L2_9STRA|nr:hypothetical protein Ae201684_007613 [Aphanomyces euteiches]
MMDIQVGSSEADMWAVVCQILDKEIPRPPMVDSSTVWMTPLTLETTIRELQTKLQTAKHRLDVKSSKSFWGRAAIQQLQDRNKSIQENAQLQEAIRERNDYIQTLQKILFKTPQWKVLPEITGAMSQSCLPADPVQRRTAINNIANWHKSRRVTAFIQAGGEVVTLQNQQLMFHSVKNIDIPAHFLAVARSSWEAVSHPQAPQTIENSEESWERVDDNLVYHRSKCIRSDGLMTQSNVIRKYSEDANCAVFAVLSVAKAMLLDDNAETDDTCGWLVFQPNPDDCNKCLMTVVFHCNLSRFVECDLPTTANFDEVSASLRRLFIAQKCLFQAVPQLLKLTQRSCEEHVSIRRAVKHAIDELRQNNKPALATPIY